MPFLASTLDNAHLLFALVTNVRVSSAPRGGGWIKTQLVAAYKLDKVVKNQYLCRTNFRHFSIPYSDQLLCNHREHFYVDTIELVEAAPSTGLS